MPIRVLIGRIQVRKKKLFSSAMVLQVAVSAAAMLAIGTTVLFCRACLLQKGALGT